MIAMASVGFYGLTLNESVGFFIQMKPEPAYWKGRVVAGAGGQGGGCAFAGSDSPWGEG
jgi:hypothetical protein